MSGASDGLVVRFVGEKSINAPPEALRFSGLRVGARFCLRFSLKAGIALGGEIGTVGLRMDLMIGVAATVCGHC